MELCYFVHIPWMLHCGFLKMNILLIDERNGRREKIKEMLEKELRCNVTDVEQVRGTGRIIEDWENEKEACRKHLNSKNPDVVLLHVGDQPDHFSFLTEICRDKIAICFTGSLVPDNVKGDCNTNPLHCYYPGSFPTEFDSDNHRLNNLTAIVKFLDSVSEYLELLQTDPHAASEILQKARNVLQNFNAELEAALNDLASELRTKLLSGNPLNHDVNQLISSRDVKFKNLLPR